MKVAGLDLSLTGTGLAVVTNGAVNVSTVKVPSAMRGVARLEHILTAVRVWVDHVDLAVLEGPSLRSVGPGHHELAGLWWVVRRALARADVPLAIVEPTRLKQYATGSGKADKCAMALAAGRRLPDVEFDTEDEIDAAWLALLGAEHLGEPLVDLPKAQRAVAERITWPVLGMSA